jgi:hypothetical protein
MTLLLRTVVCAVVAMGGWTGIQAQTDLVIRWLDEQGNPACALEEAGHTLHVSSWVDGVTQTAIQGADLVVDSTGTCWWPQVESGICTLEALPWSWTFVVDVWQEGADTVTLVWPSSKFKRLRGNDAPVRHLPGHPGAELDSLSAWMNRALDSLDLDQLVASGAVGGGPAATESARASLHEVLVLSDSVVAKYLTVPPHSLWGDLFESRVREWRMSLGATGEGEAVSAWLSPTDSRTWTEKLSSPGWCSSWELKHDMWWKSLEENRKPWRSWVATGDVDSLCSAQNWSLDELHVAMWMGMGQSWSRWAEAWWELRWTDQCDVAEVRRQSDQARRHPLTAQAWGDVMWMMPNGDLEPAWAGDGDWRIWLVTRAGSAAGMRERAILRAWALNEGSRDVSWGVLSVDSNEEGWAQTLRERESIQERVHWVGRDPSWWDRLDVSRVPQVVVVRPDGEIQTHHAALPSEGLFAELKRWKLTAR